MDTGKFGAVTKALVGRLSRRAALRRAGATAALPTLALLGHAVPARARQATPLTGAAEGVDPGWFAVVRHGGKFADGVSSADVARLVREEFVPLVAAVPGFVAYYAVDTGRGEHVTISIFSDPSGPAESSRRSADWVPRAMAGLVEGPATVLAEGPVQVYAVADAVDESSPS